MQYLEILFPDKLHPEDIEITKRPTAEQPGSARINRAQVNGGPAVRSWTGAKIGYLCGPEDLIGPFYETFEVEG